MYRRAELKELVAILEATKGGSLTTDEVTIIKGALDLSEKSANHAMTDLKHVFMLNIDSILDTFVLSDIVRAGHSRIPVFENERANIIGVLLAKVIIVVFIIYFC
jgi:metal transporter CNNM